ncbi:hypothetical protein SAMN05216298_1288 [Glycomyces sambucus]|uniref:Uncharacterized protein n=2 Tax=Glycomyces sambucus TaxID=380244 RepID=A0A1G9E4A2_9ACTN|nr:hypothetical protein SAMN05216298_1288 [Glycomyces sambucus]
MSFPPPPPDRAHLQYPPAPPQQAPAGPGGAYGPVPQRPDQMLPGQLPPPEATMRKPGSITGIQAILWIFTALAGLGDVGAAIGLVQYFTPIGLIGLAWALYSTVQALASGVHITRGKRWAWIWSLVSAIIGLALSTAAIAFGIVYIETGWVSLLVGIVLGGLYGTLLGLLCSKSARQWILMHRIQRGEVQLPGAAGPGGFAQGPAPERPDVRPGSAGFTVLATGVLMALSAWAAAGSVQSMLALGRGDYAAAIDFVGLAFGSGALLLTAVAAAVILVCGLFTAIGVHRGRFGARVFTIVWTSILVPVWGFLAFMQLVQYLRYREFPLPGQPTVYPMLLTGRNLAIAVLLVVLFVMVLTPGVRAWTPGSGGGALIVVVPQTYGTQGQYGSQPQAPYGAPQQGQTQQGQFPQQGQYPPGPPQQYPPQPPYGG